MSRLYDKCENSSVKITSYLLALYWEILSVFGTPNKSYSTFYMA